MRKIVSLFLLILCSCSVGLSQKPASNIMKKNSYIRISKPEAFDLIKNLNGIKYDFGDNVVGELYLLNDNRAILIHSFEKKAYLYFDKNDILPKNRLPTYTFENHQHLMKDFFENKKLFIDLLAEKLNLEIKTTNISKKYLDSIDMAIKKYGYENAENMLFLSIIAFVGELIIHEVGGNWELEKRNIYSYQQKRVIEYVEPCIVDKNGNKHNFFIKQIIDALNDKQKLRIEQILLLAKNR